MKIKISTNINDEKETEEIEIIINAKNNSETLNKIIESLQAISENVETILGTKENKISIINVKDVICFFSKEQFNYCKTQNGEYKVKQKLYELDEILDKSNFIRISNSCIINIKFVESFDLGKVGNIIVKFIDGTYENVSKRRIPYVMKFLKERGK